MKKWILNLLIRLYLKENRDITKLSLYEEYTLYKFGMAEDTAKLIRSLLTAQTLWYWEAKTEEERQQVKGAGMILKVMLHAHREALEIAEYGSDNKEKEEMLWKKFKAQKRTN